MIAIDDAVQYVRDNKSWSEAEDDYAFDQLEQGRNLPYSIRDQIHDLMEEWSEENDYPEGWWYDEMDEEEIFLKL